MYKLKNNQVIVRKPDCLRGLEFTKDEIKGIAECGVASYAYVPVVYYHESNKYMAEHGDNVLDYLEQNDLLNSVDITKQSWSGLAFYFLSLAVECFCQHVYNYYEDQWDDLELLVLREHESLESYMRDNNNYD